MGGSWKETEMDETQNYHGKNYEADKLLPKQLIYFSREQRGKFTNTKTRRPHGVFDKDLHPPRGTWHLDNRMGSRDHRSGGSTQWAVFPWVWSWMRVFENCPKTASNLVIWMRREADASASQSRRRERRNEYLYISSN